MSRSSQTQLLLKPTFKLSSSSCSYSSLLQELVFTSHTHSGYAHLSHRVYPLQSSAHTTAELTKISSTVGVEDEQENEEAMTSDIASQEQQDCNNPNTGQSPPEVTPISEYVTWTDIPPFLIASTPKVKHPSKFYLI